MQTWCEPHPVISSKVDAPAGPRSGCRQTTGQLRRSATSNAYDPRMLEQLHHMPDGVVGFRIDGDVEREDYTELVVPVLKAAAVDSGRGLRTLYLIEDLDDIEDA